MSAVQYLVSLEPWRLGHGLPRNALDPTWEPKTERLCNGEIEWEGRGKWWWCTKCGYCSYSTYNKHRSITSPLTYFLDSVRYYFARRRRQGTPTKVSIAQALFTAGVALRYAATVEPTQLGQYVQKNLIAR